LLKGQLVYLRALEPQDVDFILKCENDAENWRISQTLVPFSRHIIEKYVNSDQDLFTYRQIRFVICALANDKPIGTIDLFDYDPINLRAGIGILIIDSERRNGFAKESLELCIKYCFDHLLLNSLFCNILESNKQSLELFKKAGFGVVGTKREWIKTDQGWKDEILLQKVKDGK